MRSLLYAQLCASTLAFPLFHLRRNPPSYNVVSVDGHDSPSRRDLEPREPVPEAKAASPSYSVVAVDGANAPPAQTETVVTTRLSTLVVTQSETPQTVVVTITEAQAAAPTPAPANNDATVTQTVTAPGNNNDAGATQTRAYDNGMWHTTYYYTTVLPEPTAAPAPAAAPAAANAEAAAAPPPPSPATNDNQAQGGVAADTNAAPWNDASDALPGDQLVGGAPAIPGPPAGEAPTDAGRLAWLGGHWAPWATEGRGDAGQGPAGGRRGS